MTITHQEMSTGYQVVQSCHAICEYAHQYPEHFSSWKKNSNSIISLATKTLHELEKTIEKLDKLKIEYSLFYEPDVDNQLTGICFHAPYELRKKFSHLKLAGKTGMDNFVVNKTVTAEATPININQMEMNNV